MSAFSPTVMEHFLHPRGARPLAEPSGVGWAGTVEAHRYMRIEVRLDGDRVVAASFGTYGCAPAIAAGSYLCDWVCGRSVAEAESLTDEQLTEALGGLPAARRFCANLAVDALQAALCDALLPGRPPSFDTS